MSDMAGGFGITTWEECLAVERGGSSGDTNGANGMSDPGSCVLITRHDE